MCGILFVVATNNATGTLRTPEVKAALDRQSFRGPDHQQLEMVQTNQMWLGHNRLSIVDPHPRAHQPMFAITSKRSGWITFNGEIYNHQFLRKNYGLESQHKFLTSSDTETLLVGYLLHGEKFLQDLEGMYAYAIAHRYTQAVGDPLQWIVGRDTLGIKPLFHGMKDGYRVFASEAATVAQLVGQEVDEESVLEWRVARRPVPGRTFFRRVEELPGGLPGALANPAHMFYRPTTPISQADGEFSNFEFDDLLSASVAAHEMSDVANVSLLSGGMDSAAILALSKVQHAYTVGLPESNEFDEAQATADALGRDLTRVVITKEELHDNWRYLTRLRGEPLSVPNEGLIYAVCKRMQPNEKVVLTGEGADELLFGYDRIFNWALLSARERGNRPSWWEMYRYAEYQLPVRLASYAQGLTGASTTRRGTEMVDFMEDFFLRFHLSGLLRRMDFASMAAGKEARVPFLHKSLVEYCYRRPEVNRSYNGSKTPIRVLLMRRGLSAPCNRKKIGFSANTGSTKYAEYKEFQDIVLKELGWQG